jgi:hypothetical protein
MEIVVARCAGLDVHKDTVMACVRTPGQEAAAANRYARSLPSPARCVSFGIG